MHRISHRRFLYAVLFTVIVCFGILQPAYAAGFRTARSLQVGANPASVAVGDVNGDGKPDVVTVSSVSGTTDGVTVLLSNGDGTFQARKDSDTGVQPNSVVLGDLNGDGKLDAVLTEQNNRILLMLGNGDGSFQAPAIYATGALPVSAIVADLNGDGNLDVAVATLNESTISILLGNGNGTLQPFFRTNAGPNPVSITATDFNGDGKLDLAVANFNGNMVSILLNSTVSPGAFSLASQPAVGSHANSIIAKDLNGDGRADLSVVNEGDGTVSVLLGNANGTFQPQVQYAAGTQAFSVATADVNNDGKVDLLIANLSGSNISVLLGNGDGKFQPLNGYSIGGPALTFSSAPSVAAADFDQDGIPDVVTVNAGTTLSFSLGIGDGTFLAPAAFQAGINPQAVTVADFNGDGKLDLAIANAGSDNVSILLGSGDGTFGAAKNFLVQVQPYGISAADFNGDGKVDLAVANKGDNSVSILLGKGDGTFQAAVNYALPFSEADFVTTTDLNQDGKIDLLVLHDTPIGTGTQSSVDVLLGNGDGTFGHPASFQVGVGPVALSVANLNGDGKLDIAVANRLNPVSSILFGVGDGTFGIQSFTQDKTGLATWIASGDLNGDGKPDLVLPSPSCEVAPSTFRNCLHLLINNGFGFFTATDLLLDSITTGADAVAIGDFNADTKADLVVANSGGITSFQGNGDGSFQAPKKFAVSGSLRALAIGDFNGDAAPDVVAVDNYAYILLNTAGTAVETTSSFNPSGLQQNVTFTATVTPTVRGSGAPTGTVTFKEGVTVLSTNTLNASGQASFTTSALSRGPHMITASYAGDANFNPKTALPLTQLVKLASSTSLASSANSIVLGNSVTFTASVTATAGTPTGSVSFMDGGATLGSATVNSSGIATFSTSSLSGGSHTITAGYQGDADFAGSTSAAVTEAIQDYSLAASPASASIRAGQSVTFTITTTPLAGFNSQISFACSGLPALASCTFNPPIVTTNVSAVTTTLTITTTGSSAAVFNPFSGSGTFYGYAMLLGPFTCGLVLLVNKRKSAWRRMAGILLVLTLTGFWLACGGGGGSVANNNQQRPSTPMGSSTVVITATSTASGTSVTHQVPLNVTIN